MKRIYISLLSLAVLVTSCGEKSELAQKKNELKAKKEELQSLKHEIQELEQEVAALDPEFAKENRKTTLVTTLPVANKDFTHFVEVRGEVQSDRNVVVSAETMGLVQKVPVVEGQKVTKGQLLVSIDADIIQNNISEVQTQLDLATTVFEKQERLWEQKIGTEVQYLEAKNRKESLERKLATLRSQQAQAYVRAPFSGTIDNVLIKEGEMASPGTPLVRLVSLQDLYVKADVSEAYIGKFDKGDKVQVQFPNLDKTFESKITAVSQVINEGNRTFTVEVKLPENNDLLKPNSLATLKVKDFEKKDAIVIPTNLIQRDNRGEYVYVIDKSAETPRAKKVHIETGLSYANETLVTEGLKSTDMLVNEGFREVAEGMNLKIAEEGIVSNN